MGLSSDGYVVEMYVAEPERSLFECWGLGLEVKEECEELSLAFGYCSS